MVGRTVLHYRILEKLGQGGMGVVYKAEDTKLKRTVALKFLLPHILTSDEDKARFIHEAQSAAALHHPNICTIYEINEADGQTFIAMAYVEGESLSERIGRGALEPFEAVRIALQLARGLKAAHEKGIVHRDIKSSNILIAPDGRATIMDFGLAKSAYQTHATKRGTQMGTIAYMSPEQTRGDDTDRRTDIWSLGVLMYEMITGRRPFRGDYDEAVIYSILNEDAESVKSYAPDAPVDIDIVVRRAMAKEADERYQTAAELVEDLEVVHDDIRTGSSSRLRSLREGSTASSKKSGSRLLGGSRIFVVLFLFLAATVGAVKLTGWVTGRFADRDADAATKTVTLVDEEGRPVERAVPKSEFRKSLMVYFLEGETEEEETAWVGGAAMVLLQVDLYQDEFLYVRSCIEDPFRERLQKAGFTTWFDAPWSLKRETAEDAHIDYVVTGSYTIGEDDVWIFKIRVHESQSGRLVADNTHMGKDIFSVIDEAASQLRFDVGLPESHVEVKQDLPIAEMFTGSESALRYLCYGVYGALFHQDWAAAVDYLELAVAADSTFSWGYFTLFQFYQAANVPDKADPAIRAALQHRYKLPERMQFLLKAVYYGHVQDPEKQLGVLEMMIELYPDAIEAREILAEIRSNRNERQMEIEQYEKILEIDPSRTEYLQRIANSYEQMGDFDRALEYYEAYRMRYPDDADAYHELGILYERNGDYDEARSHYEKTLVLDPNDAPAMADLGDVESKLNNDERALETYAGALEVANTPQDRERVHRSLLGFYSTRGQVKKVVEQVWLSWAEREKYMAPIGVEIEKLFDLCYFVRAGRTEQAFDILESVKTNLVPPYDEFAVLGELCIYVELSQPDSIEPALARLNTLIETYQDGRSRDDALWAEGEMEEARGNYEAAIDCYRRILEIEPTQLYPYRSIGRCYRNLERHEDALSSINEMLNVYPNNAIANYEVALVYHEMGDETRAMLHLQKALDRWKNADPIYKPAQEARATLARWQS